MTEKKYIDPTLSKTITDGKTLDTRTMKRKRGRPRKEQTGESSKASVCKTIRYTENEYEEVKRLMEKNQIARFSQYARCTTLNMNPIIISTEDFTLLRQARRDIVNYSNIIKSKKLSPKDRHVLFSKLNVQEEWGTHLIKLVEEIDNLINRLKNKINVKQ